MNEIERRVLLVEGKDDQHVVKNLLVYHKIPCHVPTGDENDEDDSAKILILSREGIENVLEDFRVRINESDLTRLGIIVDADTDLESRWTALRDVLVKNDYEPAHVPVAPDPAGTIVEQEDKPTIGFWLMPDNVLPGMLEDFLRFLIPTDDTLWERVKHCVDAIPVAERPFAITQLSKVHLHTWLAWQKAPGKPLGLAITHKLLQANSPQAQDLIAWLRRLFNFPK